MIFFLVFNEIDVNLLRDKGLICNLIKMYKNVVIFFRNLLINEFYN